MQPQPQSPLTAVTEAGGVLVARFACSALTSEMSQEAGARLFALVEGRERPRMVLNLGGVTYLASAVLARIITLNQKARAAGGRLVLCAAGPELLEVIKVTGLDQAFTVYPTEREAQQSFSG